MTDLEKILTGLAACMPQTEEDAAIGCNGCPYNGNPCGGDYQDNDHVNLPVRMIEDIRALLKAQEPRVMTLEEVKSMKRYTICAVEQHSKLKLNVFNAEYRGCFAIGQKHMLDFGLYMDVNPYRRSEGGYDKTWRCWTARPSDEVRRATPWN